MTLEHIKLLKEFLISKSGHAIILCFNTLYKEDIYLNARYSHNSDSIELTDSIGREYPIYHAEIIDKDVLNFNAVTLVKDLFEDFTSLKWVKWTTRKPTHNGSIFMRFNGKNVGTGHVFDGQLIKHECLNNDDFENYENTFYWLEETVDVESFTKYNENN